MGLTIHFRLSASDLSPRQARDVVAKLRQRALELPFAHVGELLEFTGDDCDYKKHDRDDAGCWLLVEAREHVEQRAPELGHCYYEVLPTHVIAFHSAPGDGCEPANVGLCRYPATIRIPDPRDPARKRRIATGLHGWQWGSFCKTEYASRYGGVENFLRCHLVVVRLLDYAKQLGVLDDVSDEGGFWEQRDVNFLARTVCNSNETIDAAVGKLKDQFGDELLATIGAFPSFEYLEAGGRKGEDKKNV